MTAMRVYLGSDHAGFELKQEIIDHLKKNGHEPIDCGAYTYDAEDDYPAFCIAAALKTVGDPESLGIVLGGSGNGEQIAANKVPGARCALAWSVETATLARQHNNAQLIGIGGRMHTVPEALAIVDAFLGAEWSKAERHQRRIDILAEYEADARPAARFPAPQTSLDRSTCLRAIRCTGWRGCTSAGSGARPSSCPAPRAASPTGPPPSTAGC